MDKLGVIESLFGVKRALIGVIHLQALPGTPASKFDVATIKSMAVEEAHLFKDEGFHGIVLENTHDRPYLKTHVGPEIVAAMSVICADVRRAVALPLGIQVLAGANSSALAVALACEASFVRVEGFVFAHVADEGIIESSAGPLLRYRRAIGADHIRVFADVKKKHSAHAITADVDLVEVAVVRRGRPVIVWPVGIGARGRPVRGLRTAAEQRERDRHNHAEMSQHALNPRSCGQWASSAALAASC